MEYPVIILAAFFVAGLTLFSGFGLGTLLLPVFTIFLPVEMAVAATALVHLANNLLKALLLGRDADLGILVRFALPAVPAAMAGAWLLGRLGDMGTLADYAIAGRVFTVTVSKAVIALLIAVFALAELAPGRKNFAFPPGLVPLGGLLSGFFGGLSGHQGALRTAFLLRAGLGKEAFLGTMVLAAVLVDLSRMLVYGSMLAGGMAPAGQGGVEGLVAAGTLAAFCGTWLGSRLVRKVTLRTVRAIVAVLLFALALALGAGVI